MRHTVEPEKNYFNGSSHRSLETPVIFGLTINDVTLIGDGSAHLSQQFISLRTNHKSMTRMKGLVGQQYNVPNNIYERPQTETIMSILV